MRTGGERATLGAGVERVAVLVAGGHGRRTATVALLVLSTARRHLDVLTPMHAEASSACAVMGTGMGKATLGAGVYGVNEEEVMLWWFLTKVIRKKR